MFKEQNRIWLYLLGILIMFGILVLMSRNVISPIAHNQMSFSTLYPVADQDGEISINTNLNYFASINTNRIQIQVDLYEKDAPINVSNFIDLANHQFYNDTIFHRVIKDKIAQGGDPNTRETENPSSWGKGGPRYVVKDEKNRNLEQFSLAMANNGDNTNGSQFFIVLAENESDFVRNNQNTFTVIGKVLNEDAVLEFFNSIEINDSLTNFPTPLTEIKIQGITVYTQ